MITKADALMSLRPDAQWTLRGNDIEWLDAKITQPTDAEITAEVQKLEAIQPKIFRIAEIKQLLADTDYKVLPDYDKTDTEVVAQRQAWRSEVRQLQADVATLKGN